MCIIAYLKNYETLLKRNNFYKIHVGNSDHICAIQGIIKAIQNDFEKGLELAEKTLLDEGFDFENNEFWHQIKANPSFKTELFKKLKSKLDKQFHYHKELNKSGMH